MPVEIERKFLVQSDDWRASEVSSERIRQGYLARDGQVTVRIRLAGDSAFLTIKGEGGLVRDEFEYAIPTVDAENMLSRLCPPPLIEKVRHRVPYSGLIWQIDTFEGDHTGLVLAEVELTSPDQQIDLPPWAGTDVTHDPRYRNATLARRAADARDR